MKHETQSVPGEGAPVDSVPARLRLYAAALEAGLKKDYGPTHPQAGKFTPEFLKRCCELMSAAASELERSARAVVSHWIALPVEDGLSRPRFFEGNVYRVRDERGEIRCATWERSPGGGHAFYDGGEPIYATAVEVSR